MPAKLHLTDGTTTIDMDDVTGNFPLLEHGYIPGIAGLRDDAYAERGPHNDVIDEIHIDVNGASAAAAYANLASLNRLLEQAKRWKRPENGATLVKLQYSPDGATTSSSGTPLQAIVYGPAPGDESSGVGLVAEWDEAAYNFVIPNVTIRFWRRGVWYLDSETLTDSARNSGVLVTYTFSTDLVDFGAIDVSALTGAMGTAATLDYCVLIAGGANVEGSSPIKLIEAEDLNLGGVPYTSIADAANIPTGNILRFTAADANPHTSNTASIGTNLDSSRRFHIYATVRNNSADTFNVYFDIVSATGRTYASPVKFIDASSTAPRVVYFGSIGLGIVNNGLGSTPTIQVTCEATVGAGSPTLDFDQIVIYGEDDLTMRVLEFPLLQIMAGATTTKVNISSSVMSSLEPDVFATVSGAPAKNDPITAYGDTWLPSKGTKYYMIWLITDGVYWRFNDGGTAETINTTLIRSRLLVAPQ